MYICVYTHVCVYIYSIYTCIYIYTCTYTYMYTYTCYYAFVLNGPYILHPHIFCFGSRIAGDPMCGEFPSVVMGSHVIVANGSL